MTQNISGLPFNLNVSSMKNSGKNKSKQSANTLFHFMSRFEFLTEMILNKKINPRYCDEKFSFLDEKFPDLMFPMKCFCDIHLNRLGDHMKLYGNYGIGFDKEWLISKGLQPIQYVNVKSEIAEKIQKEFSEYMQKHGIDFPKEVYHNSLFQSLRYVKPLNGYMSRDGIGDVECNFHDEKEWRYIPRIEDENDIPLMINTAYIDSDKKNKYNEKLSSEKNINIRLDEIKYLIVPSQKNRDELIDFIFKAKKIKEFDRLVLISKILVFDNLKEDW